MLLDPCGSEASAKAALWLNQQETYLATDQLLLDKLSPEDQKIFQKRRNLSDLVRIERIEDNSHPCFGQLGLFAARNLKAGSYVGEYTGRVLLMNPELMSSKYLVDYSNPYEEDCSQVWVDAWKEGNEIRFINDCRGTGKTENITFKR